MLPEPTLRILLIGLTAATLALALSGTILWLLHRSYAQRIAVAYQLEKNKHGYEAALLQVRLEVQEQTFSHISREIHDNIGQKLSLVKLYFNTIQAPLPVPEQNRLGFALDVLSDTLEELRDLSHSMDSQYLERNGLIQDLAWELDLLRKSGQYRIEFQVNGEAWYMDSSKELVVFRMLQEAINNILRHAGANMIFVALHYEPNWLSIQLSDNGRGIPSDNPRGLGMEHMQRVTQLLGGSVAINSHHQKGTTIHFKIPQHEKATHLPGDSGG